MTTTLAPPVDAANAPAIELRSVDKTYGAGRSARHVVKDCSFAIESGRCTVLMGPSGAGKSTLVRLIAGFEAPTRGEVRAAGAVVKGPGRDRQVMFQETALFPWMITEENVVYGPKARHEYGERAKRLGDALIRRVGLDGFRSKYPAQLSGGMQRRAELARALINNPSVLILDEPFRGLDAMTKRLMLEYYAELSRESARTSLFVTTDVDEAIFLADRLLLLTHIPARVREVIDVDLPRRRTVADLFDDPRANDLKRRVLDALHEEAAKSFSAGERASSDFVDSYRLRLGAPPRPQPTDPPSSR
jgi:NitT/TauT family transport system ATP-binding protein